MTQKDGGTYGVLIQGLVKVYVGSGIIGHLYHVVQRV